MSELKLLGLNLTDDLSWSRNCKEICIKAYSRLQMITKLKHVGVQTEDLLDVYKLYIRSITEYCFVAFHSSLTVDRKDTESMCESHPWRDVYRLPFSAGNVWLRHIIKS